MSPEERRLLRTLGLLVAGLLVVAAAVVVTSPLTCPLVPSMDTCSKVPLCSPMYIHATDGPSWACEPRFFDGRSILGRRR